MDPSAFVFMALSGEQQFGPSSGVVMVDPQEFHAKYTLLDQLEPHAFAEQMRTQLELHPENLYVVSKSSGHLHVFAYERERAHQDLKEGKLSLT